MSSPQERDALKRLDEVRAPLFRELARVRDAERARGDAEPAEPEHLSCLRDRNQMRISPLEARSIEAAFRRSPRLASRLPAVLRRLEKELEGLEDTGERQRFSCPLLEGNRCLVHEEAKPIGCLAWYPGRDFSAAGWRAFARRDALNDRIYGGDWKLRVIPLWLKRVFARDLRSKPRPCSASSGAREALPPPPPPRRPRAAPRGS